NPTTTAINVIPTIHQAANVCTPDAEPSPRIRAGTQRPTTTFALFELSDSLTQAAPRPCKASRTAAIRLGMLVRAARTSAPTTTPETDQRSASDCAAATMP